MFLSCESRDGDWPPMKWKSDGVSHINKTKDNIEVSQAGNSYMFTCKNIKVR